CGSSLRTRKTSLWSASFVSVRHVLRPQQVVALSLANVFVKCRGLRGVLLALPLIALGGYTVIAAGASFALVRWIKTAENATDYSIMNTARQLLWLPTSPDEKNKAKQAPDTFFARGGHL